MTLEYYNSIDELPIFNWLKIQKSNDLSWLLFKKRECGKEELVILEKCMGNLIKEYIDTFGISDEYRRILQITRDIVVMEIEMLQTGDESLETFINIKRAELKALAENTEKTDMDEVQIHAKRFMKGNLNMRETSVKEFYTILKMIKESKDYE